MIGSWSAVVVTTYKDSEKALFYLKVPNGFTLGSGCGDFHYAHHDSWDDDAQFYKPLSARVVLATTLPADVEDVASWTGDTCNLAILKGDI